MEEGVLKPQMIARPIEGFPKVVIGCFHQRFIDIASRRFALKKETAIFAGAPYPVYSLDWQGQKLGLFLSCEGSMAAAVFMEELIAHGAKGFVYFGSCGSLDSRATHNTLIVPTHAYCNEGVALHYGQEEKWIANPCASMLSQMLSRMFLPRVEGKVWTTSAPYRELPSTIKSLKAQGCIAVDMECASLIAVAAFRSVPCLQFLYSEDKLDGPQWDQGTLGSMKADSASKFLEIALQTAGNLNSILN
jgi:uridine phosphorylase